MIDSRNVLTIATGKELYIKMAVNLARSFWWWNRESGINFYIATDLQEYLPPDVSEYAQIIPLKPDELGKGFSPKLHLDKLALPGQTLFIDSDCLIYGDIQPVFEKFKGHSVSVVGEYIAEGEWFGDVAAICAKFNVRHLPKFNGGVYYVEQGEIATKIYETARDLEARYDEIGFIRLRGRPNDEVLMALAMELGNATPIDDDGSILAEFVNFQSGIKSDVLNGSVELYNDPHHPHYQKKWPLKIARPLIVHFLGHHNVIMPYIKEIKLLKYISDNYPVNKARVVTYFQITLPFTIISQLKGVFRSAYHLIFGARKIKRSERLVS